VCVFLWTPLSKRWSIGIQLFLRDNYETLTWKIDSFWLFFDCESTSSPQQRPQTKSWKQRACVKRKSLKREKRLVQSFCEWVCVCVMKIHFIPEVCEWAQGEIFKSEICSHPQALKCSNRPSTCACVDWEWTGRSELFASERGLQLCAVSPNLSRIRSREREN